MSTQTTAAPATAPKPIDQVTTLVVKLPGLRLDQVLAKFEGQRTVRTLQAARRIAAKPVEVKIPRNLMRMLFRITGGFTMQGWKPCPTGPVPGQGNAQGDMRSLFLGDMEVVLQTDGNQSYGPAAWLCFRGQWIAQVVPDYRNNHWLNKDLAVSAAKSLGTAWPKPTLACGTGATN